MAHSVNESLLKKKRKEKKKKDSEQFCRNVSCKSHVLNSFVEMAVERVMCLVLYADWLIVVCDSNLSYTIILYTFISVSQCVHALHEVFHIARRLVDPYSLRCK